MDKREVSTKVGNHVLHMFSQISNCRRPTTNMQSEKRKKKNVPSVQESIELLYGFKQIMNFKYEFTEQFMSKIYGNFNEKNDNF